MKKLITQSVQLFSKLCTALFLILISGIVFNVLMKNKCEVGSGECLGYTMGTGLAVYLIILLLFKTMLLLSKKIINMSKKKEITKSN